MEFVAFVGDDRENWGQVTALMKRMEADKNILVMNKNASDFPVDKKSEIIKIDSSVPLLELKTELLEKLKRKLSGDFEVTLSLASGNGKEHMALLSALLSIPVGVKLAVFTKEGVQFLS